jgi:serine-type D-Ala-D-Ala carboxypeptidase (penicillin-binding protein 5/6)
LLEAGRKRRGPGRRIALVALIVLTLAGAGAAAYLELIRDRHDGGPSFPAALSAPSSAAATRSPLPVRQPVPHIRLSGARAFQMHFSKPPGAALVFDAGNGDVLGSLRARKRMPIASLTKIMTALLVTERAGPNERVRITPDTLRYQGSGVGVLPKNRRVRFEALLNGLLIVSGNDAAIALADHVSGSQRRFVTLMNRRARQLGLHCTHFVSPHGLEPGNRSCARDLAVLTRLAVHNKRIMRVARRRQVQLRFPVKGGHIFLPGHNPLYRAHYKGALGLKTGFIDEAGRCFVGVARRHGRTLGVVLLHSANPQSQAPALLDLGFRS